MGEWTSKDMPWSAEVTERGDGSMLRFHKSRASLSLWQHENQGMYQ